MARYNKHTHGLRFTLRQQRGLATGAITMTVTYQAERFRYSTSIRRVDPDAWDKKRERMTGKSLHAVQVNATLEALRERVRTYFARPDATMAGLRCMINPDAHPGQTEAETVAAYFERFVTEHRIKGKQPSINTRKSYAVVLRAWRAFEAHARTTYDLQSLRVLGTRDREARALVGSFDRFLATIGATGTPVVDNTRRKYLKIFSTFLRWAERDTDIPLVRGVNAGGDIIARGSFSLTAAECEAIEAVELTYGSRQHHVRNAMVMALNTGLRFSEWRSVNPKLWREPSQPVTMPKTGRTALVVHRDAVRRVLKEYSETGLPAVLGHNHKVNEVMKEVAAKAGLTRLVAVTYTYDGQDRHEMKPLHEAISTHTLRRTKVTLALDNGTTLRDVCIETGQDEATARKHYDRPDHATHVSRLGIERIEE